MQDTRLEDAFQKLSDAIDQLDPADHATRGRLQDLLSGLEHKLSSPGDAEHHTALVASVQDAIGHLEAGHPRTTAILNDIFLALSNMGI